MPPPARAQFQGGNCRRGRMQSGTRLGDGLRGYFRSVQTDLGKTRPSLFERNRRAGESDQRKCGCLDLEEIKAETAVADRGGGRGDLHGAMCLSGLNTDFYGVSAMLLLVTASCGMPVS